MACRRLPWLAAAVLSSVYNLTAVAAGVVDQRPGGSGSLGSCRQLLSVKKGASASELKRAYRREALNWHPDKNSAPDAEERFREVAECFDLLSNPEKASAPGGGFSSGGFDSRRAHATFDDLFGDVHRSWKPGMTVSGTLVNNGKRVKITIHPDGTTEEHEEKADGRGKYSTMYKADGNSVSLHIDGDVRELIVDTLREKLPLPEFAMSLLSTAIFAICNPLVCCAACCYCCYIE
eukprot:TRINITY_DN39175_c0_g1_i3.p1 TRINITY_DN39175_c0_g1~~TRINITY_DN39175_c0_g1_i3.p1  ORF type:complete len:257 (-),score=30.26 TRINITY_DN39175_c0_g1_i3:76-780(-)